MKKIGIIGAMEIEVDHLKADMPDAQVVTRAGREFYTGTLCGREAVVVRCGVGKVNAASCTQTLIDVFGVDCVINTGVAGSLDASIDIGDFVASTDAVHHDMDACLFGYAPGQVPQMEVFSFPADEGLAAAAEKACGEVNPDIRIHRGRIASGDQFIESKDRKEWIRSTFHASCAEMEGAAIAHTAWLNGVPFLILRAISDKADDSAQVDYPVFEEAAARSSYRLIERMLELIE